MARAFIDDPESVERIYGRDAFERDASRNAQGDATVTHGVTILSGPDAEGGFELTTNSRHVAESDPESDDIFLAASDPHASAATAGSTYAGSIQPAGADESDEYPRFIDKIRETARSAKFKPAIGKGDDRIKGFRGG